MSATTAFMAHHRGVGCDLTHAHSIAECRPLCLHDGIEDASDCPQAVALARDFAANTAARIHAVGYPMRVVENIAAGRIPAVHPYRPSAIRNDRCLDCGEYEEDGPHIAATD